MSSQRQFTSVSRLLGMPGLGRLHRARVAVVGLGGVGSWAAEALARSGVGHLDLIDMDQVAISNINRQIQATWTTHGKAKVEAMRERILTLHPACEVRCVEDFLGTENAEALIAPDTDFIVDACDQVRAKHALVQLARARGVGLILSGAAGGKLHAERTRLVDLRDVTHDPLLARLRTVLRREARQAETALDASASASTPTPPSTPTRKASAPTKAFGLPCVYADEPTLRPDDFCERQSEAAELGGFDPELPRANLNCSGYGSLVSVTATFGMVMAGAVIRALALPTADKPKRPAALPTSGQLASA